MTPHPDHASADPSASTNAMAAALEAIRSGAATYAQASATWGIPQGTLKARIKRERAAQAKAPDPQRACNQGATAAQPTVIDLGTLHADPSNARIHDQRNKAAIAASIERHGFLGAVVVEKTTGRILAGNERTQQALAAGMLEGVVVQYDPQRQVPVIMADLDGREADRFALTDNRTAELAVWDDDLLAKVLADMGEMGDLWTAAEIKAQVAGLAPPSVQEDETTPLPVPETAVSQLGEVYELGPHRLVCGDSRSPEAWAALGGGLADVAWTDPPYGVAVNQVANVEEARRLRRRTDGKMVQNDALDAAGLKLLLADALGLLVANLKPGGSLYVAAPAGPLHNVYGEVLIALDVWRRSLIWLKDIFAFGRGDYHYRHEPIFYGWRPGAAHYFIDDRTQDTVLEFPRPKRSEEHPTMKPVALVERCLVNSSRDGEMVLDPFGGSGTTLIAAAQTGRIAHLIELDPRYCDVIRRRWTRWAKANGADPGSGVLE